jgi:hypothetical protein
MTLYEKTVRRDSNTDKYDSLQEAYMKVLNERAPKKENLKFGDQVDQNSKHRKGIGKAKIDNAIYDWAFKKFGKGNEISITNKDVAIRDQKISIHKPKGSMGSVEIIITPFGDYIQVLNDQGGGMGKGKKEFYKV